MQSFYPYILIKHQNSEKSIWAVTVPRGLCMQARGVRGETLEQGGLGQVIDMARGGGQRRAQNSLPDKEGVLLSQAQIIRAQCQPR